MPAPTVVGGSGNTASSGNVNAAFTTPSGTQVGDLILVGMYIEPANEGTASATYGTITLPVGYTLIPGYPLNTDDAQMASVNATHRMYLMWAYATAVGAQQVSWAAFSNSGVYCGLACVVIRGGTTSGVPYSEITNAVSRSQDAPPATTPPVALTLAGLDSLVLWIPTIWDGSLPAGEATGFTAAASPTNQNAVPHIASQVFSASGAIGTVSTTSNNSTQGGMTATLMSLRSPATGPTGSGYPIQYWNGSAIQTGTLYYFNGTGPASIGSITSS